MDTRLLCSRVRYWWRKEIRSLLILGVTLFAIRSSLADWSDVPTGSMKPTILEGDRVFVNKLAYDLKVPFTTRHVAEWSNPRRGDIVVFFSPYDGKRLVKRVVGLPGDTIELRSRPSNINPSPKSCCATSRRLTARSGSLPPNNSPIGPMPSPALQPSRRGGTLAPIASRPDTIL